MPDAAEPQPSRLFAAVEVSDAERGRLQRWLAGTGLEQVGLRLVAAEQWHITVAFFGAVPGGRVAELTTRLGRAAARTPPLRLELAGVGTFPSNRARARVLWVGVGGDTTGLERLAARSAAAGRRVGLAMPDGPFRPHLTLGRARQRTADLSTLPPAADGYVGSPWTVTSVRLVRSTLGSVVRHDTVAEIPLGGAEPATASDG